MVSGVHGHSSSGGRLRGPPFSTPAIRPASARSRFSRAGEHLLRFFTKSSPRICSARRTAVCLVLLAGLGASTPSFGEDRGEAVRRTLASMRNRFHQTAADMAQPEELTALGFDHAARAWSEISRAFLEEHPDEKLKRGLERFHREYEQVVKGARHRPGKRQAAGMELMYHALEALTVVLASGRGDGDALEEIRAIRTGVERLRGLDKGYDHEIVVFSQGAVSVLALMTRCAEEEYHYTLMAEMSLAEILDGARAIRKRRDAHYRGRLYLLAANNLGGCVRMMSWLVRSVEKGSAAEMERVLGTWRKYGGQGVSSRKRMVVTAAALAEASFVSALALTTRLKP